MHIRRVTIRALSLALPRPWGPEVPSHHLVVTEVERSDGATGVGFTWTPQIGRTAVAAMIADECRPAVEGGPATPELVWDRLWWRLHEAGGGGITTLALAAIDIALWDLRARAAGQSLVAALGRRRAHVPTYGSGVNLHYSLDELEEQARRWVAAGHRGVKIKVGKPDIDEDAERVAAVRRVIGPDRLLMIDANQRWDLPTARRALRALERHDLHWIEEPLIADDVPAHADLRRRAGVPVALGENLYTTYQFRDVLVAGAADYLQPNVARVGGITPFLRIAELARTHHVPVVPHLLPDLSGQLAHCLPLATMVEDVEDASLGSLGALAEPGPVRIAGGACRVEDTVPGHGLRFTAAAPEPAAQDAITAPT